METGQGAGLGSALSGLLGLADAGVRPVAHNDRSCVYAFMSQSDPNTGFALLQTRHTPLTGRPHWMAAHADATTCCASHAAEEHMRNSNTIYLLLVGAALGIVIRAVRTRPS